MTSDKRQFLFRLTEDDDRKLGELMEHYGLDSRSATLRRLIRKAYTADLKPKA